MDQFSLNLIMIIGFVLGSGLIVLEAFIPGFGVAGICGVVLEVAALYCCWQLFGVGTALLAFVAVLVLIALALLIYGSTRRRSQAGSLDRQGRRRGHFTASRRSD